MKLTKNHYKFFIIAGEASGDLLGSKLINELKKQLINKSCSFEFIGIGGKLMQEQGLDTIFAIEELSLMGFVEILPHIPKLIKLINFTAQQIIANEVDTVISIDAPDFSFRILKPYLSVIQLLRMLQIWLFVKKKKSLFIKEITLILTIF